MSLEDDLARLTEHLRQAHGVGEWALKPTVWGVKRDIRGATKAHAKLHRGSVNHPHPLKGRPAVDDRPWKVQEGGGEAEGYAVIGYRDPITDPLGLGRSSTLYGPYSTLEDAEAVVAAKDPMVRPLGRGVGAP